MAKIRDTAVSSTPSGDVEATDLRAAIAELAAEKMAVVTPGTAGNVLTSDGTVWTSATPPGGSGGLTQSQVLALQSLRV